MPTRDVRHQESLHLHTYSVAGQQSPSLRVELDALSRRDQPQRREFRLQTLLTQRKNPMMICVLICAVSGSARDRFARRELLLMTVLLQRNG